MERRRAVHDDGESLKRGFGEEELDQTSKHREKIERWLEKYDSQGNAIQKLNQGRTSEQPENKDFKEWLKEQSERINE